MTFKPGDLVRVTFEGRTVDAFVVLASTNGRSLMLGFDAMLGGFVGMMPVLDERGTGDYRDLVQGRPVVVTPQRSH